MTAARRDAGRAGWVEDDNRLPTEAARLKLRLVNAVAETVLPLAMTLDFGPVADSVAVGSASPYASVEPTTGGGTDGVLSITTPALGSPLLTLSDQILRANGVYSVFLAGTRDAPLAVLRKDR